MLAVLRQNSTSRTHRASTPPLPHAGIAFTELGLLIDAIHTGLRPDHVCSVAGTAFGTGMITAGLCMATANRIHLSPYRSAPAGNSSTPPSAQYLISESGACRFLPCPVHGRGIALVKEFQ